MLYVLKDSDPGEISSICNKSLKVT